MLVLDEAQQLRACVCLVDNSVANVRAIEAGSKHARTAKPEASDDLGARLRVGGCSERDARDLRIALVQQRQLQILGAKIVPPLRHAVRFVGRKQRQLRAVGQLEAARGGQALGRDVEHVELAGEERALGGPRRIGVEGRVEERCAHAQLGQCRDLILHQRDQRRDHDASPLPDERWNLIAQRFATAGRHQHQRIAPRHDMVDDLALRVAECGVAKGVAQHFDRTREIRVHGAQSKGEMAAASPARKRATAAPRFSQISVWPDLPLESYPSGVRQQRRATCPQSAPRNTRLAGSESCIRRARFATRDPYLIVAAPTLQATSSCEPVPPEQPIAPISLPPSTRGMPPREAMIPSRVSR